MTTWLMTVKQHTNFDMLVLIAICISVLALIIYLVSENVRMSRGLVACVLADSPKKVTDLAVAKEVHNEFNEFLYSDMLGALERALRAAGYRVRVGAENQSSFTDPGFIPPEILEDVAQKVILARIDYLYPFAARSQVEGLFENDVGGGSKLVRRMMHSLGRQGFRFERVQGVEGGYRLPQPFAAEHYSPAPGLQARAGS